MDSIQGGVVWPIIIMNFVAKCSYVVHFEATVVDVLIYKMQTLD